MSPRKPPNASKDELVAAVEQADRVLLNASSAAVEAREALEDAIRRAAPAATIREIADVCSLGRSSVGTIIKG